MKKPLEDWAGVKLKPTAAYGIRSYQTGSVLHAHVDRLSTHVISAIINVAQVGDDVSWPLFITDVDGIMHSMNMAPGEMILYESAKCIHGRPLPYNGTTYTNLFVHFAPTEWEHSG